MNLKSMTLPELAEVLKQLGQPGFRAKQVYTWLHKGVRSYDEMTNLPKPLRDTLAQQYPILPPKVVRKQESQRDGTIKYLWELSPKPLRDTLAQQYPILPPKVVRKQESQRDGTIKYLWELSDGNCVETVLMRYHYGNTVCISTEVGCRMGCAFCASTLGGLVRRLEPFDGNCVETVLMRYHYGNTVCISTEVGCRMGCAFCASTLGGLVRRLEPFEMLDQVLFTQVDSGLPISHIVLMGIGEPLDNFDNVMR